MLFYLVLPICFVGGKLEPPAVVLSLGSFGWHWSGAVQHKNSHQKTNESGQYVGTYYLMRAPPMHVMRKSSFSLRSLQ